MARGHSVQLVTSHKARPTRAPEDGLDVVRQWRPPEPARLRLPPGSSAAPGAWWALRRGDADIAQGWTIPAALAAAKSGKPSVFVFQGVLDEADLEGRPRVRSMLLRAASECDAVVAYSEVAAEALSRIAGVEARPIEPGIRLDVFTPSEADAAAHSRAPTIFCAADPAEPRKRVGLLVEAFKKVRAQRPDAELLLMQRGSDP